MSVFGVVSFPFRVVGSVCEVLWQCEVQNRVLAAAEALADAEAETEVWEAAERLDRNPVTKRKIQDADLESAVEMSPAVPPAGDSPDEVELGSPPIASAPSSGSDLGGYTAPEVFAPEYVPTSELLHSAAHMIGLFNQDDIACALMSQLRERADMFRAVEDVPK